MYWAVSHGNNACSFFFIMELVWKGSIKAPTLNSGLLTNMHRFVRYMFVKAGSTKVAMTMSVASPQGCPCYITEMEPRTGRKATQKSEVPLC